MAPRVAGSSSTRRIVRLRLDFFVMTALRAVRTSGRLDPGIGNGPRRAEPRPSPDVPEILPDESSRRTGAGPISGGPYAESEAQPLCGIRLRAFVPRRLGRSEAPGNTNSPRHRPTGPRW